MVTDVIFIASWLGEEIWGNRGWSSSSNIYVEETEMLLSSNV